MSRNPPYKQQQQDQQHHHHHQQQVTATISPRALNMSRHLSSEAFQLPILRSSPSQQPLAAPPRSCSLDSQGLDDIMESGHNANNDRSHKLDLYSIPVFLLEVLLLAGLGYLAYFVHIEYKHQPFITGFYCDDQSYRQHFESSSVKFLVAEYELTFYALVTIVPIVIIAFCELVNSMFGALKFRRIRALCKCCKLHSITRRTIRFSGAFLLGLFIVMISADILASSTGRLRPYFAQECPEAYVQCLHAPSRRQPESPNQGPTPGASDSGPQPASGADQAVPVDMTRPASEPILNALDASASSQPTASSPTSVAAGARRAASLRAGRSMSLGTERAIADQLSIIERQWIDLSYRNLADLCRVSQPAEVNQLAMSWPSFPAAIFTYSCLFLACYLSYVGTARPFRMLTCLIVVLLMIAANIFNVHLVKTHFHHWDDVVSSSVLGLFVVVFVLIVYLNRFRDTHYYEKQKLLK